MNNLTLSKFDLLNALNSVYSAIGKPDTKALDHLKCEVSGSTLTFTANNLELQLTSSVYLGEIYEDFSFLIPARKFKELITAIPDSVDVTIKVNHKENLHHLITYSGSRAKYKLVGLDPDIYPNIVIGDSVDSVSFDIAASDFHFALLSVSDSAAANDARYYLNGVNLDISEKSIVFCGTDGHRLSRYTLDIETATTGSCILPKKSTLELLRQLIKIDGNILININENHFSFSVGGYSYVTTLVDGNYPDTNRVIPQGNTQTFKVDSQIMLDAINRSNVLVNSKHKCARFLFSNDNITIQSTNAEREHSVEQFDIIEDTLIGDDIEIGLNLDYLSRAFKMINSDEVDISLKDSNSAILLTSHNNPNHISVLMPTRL